MKSHYKILALLAAVAVLCGISVIFLLLRNREPPAEDRYKLDPTKTAWLASTTITKTRGWSPTVVRACLQSGAIQDVPAYKAAYRFHTAPAQYSLNMPSIIFTDPRTRNVWAGPQADFYIETESGILGVMNTSGILDWYTSAINKLAPGESEGDVISRYDRQKWYIDLEDAPLSGETDFRDILNWQFFNATPGSSNGAPALLKSIILNGDTLELYMHSPTEVFNAKAWIDVKTKNVIRAMEGGKLVFPKPATQTTTTAGEATE